MGDHTTRLLDVQNVSLARGSVTVVKAANVTVNRGEIVGIVGRNGVGKTTLLHGIVGWLPTASGRIVLAGEPIERLAPEVRCRRGLGFVPDSRELFWSMTVEENLILAWKNGGRVVGDLQDRKARICAIFPTVRDLLRRRCDSLSGGQQQIVTIARALATEPDLLILDEPTFGLSPSITEEVLRHIEALRHEGLSVLLVEQSLDVVMDAADVIYVMAGGTCGPRLEAGDATAEKVLDSFLHG